MLYYQNYLLWVGFIESSSNFKNPEVLNTHSISDWDSESSRPSIKSFPWTTLGEAEDCDSSDWELKILFLLIKSCDIVQNKLTEGLLRIKITHKNHVNINLFIYFKWNF